MKTFTSFIVVCVLGFTAFQASAAVGVGDSVSDMAFTSAQGGKVSVAALKGKLIVIDFWATWCGPCMHEAPHMVAINDKYGKKGLVFLGVSLDQDAAPMMAGAKAAGLTWPQVIDGGKFSGRFGVDSIPRTFLVGPDGKVLWTGHPAGGLDAAIEDAFKNHPPFMVDPAVVAEATKLLDQADAKIDAKDPKSAMKLLGKIPAEAKTDEKFAARDKEVETKLSTSADEMLAEVDPLISAGNYTEAVSKLKALSDGLTGSPAGTKAKKELTELLAKPEAKAALAKADKEARDNEKSSKAADALAAAMKLQEEKKDDQAYMRFKAIVADYAGTPSADTAEAQVKAYDKKNPNLATNANEAAVGGKAKAALSMAATYERLGKYDQAREKYQSVIDTYPGTSFAKTAKEQLANLPAQ